MPERQPDRRRWRLAAAWLALGAQLCGCAGPKSDVKFARDENIPHMQRVATEMEFADARAMPVAQHTDAPLTLGSAPSEFWDVTLEQSVQLCLQNSQVMRDLGGFVLRSPQTIRTIQEPALAEADPRFGVEAALSEFDTTFAARTSWEKNDRAINNLLLGGGTNFFKQDLGVMQYQLQKRAATGGTMTFRHNTDYDANNAPANLFGSAWNTNFELEARQPLLAGAGVQYNRIAGPSGAPGQYNGVLIARANVDIALADFEIGVRNLVSNVENAYWDLYYAYRDLDAKIAARDTALESWRRVQALYQARRKGGEAEKEAQAREQYFRFQEDVQNALAGRLIDGTQTNNGSSGGTFRATGGVQVAERRLRLIMGLPITDGRLLRPADEPRLAAIRFDWNTMMSESLVRRTELRKQQWQIKRRELELVASKNFLLPNLDTVGRYRFRGFGKDLIDANGNGGQFDNAYENLIDGDFQEWQMGLELNMPLGFRRGFAAVRSAELQLARERALLYEQERDVQIGLSNAVAELDRAYAVAQTNYNRRAAAKEQLAAISAAFDADKATLDLTLEAQRRALESESRFHAALVDYALAMKNVHFEKGTLLDYNEISLSEGPWPGKAYADAERRDGRGRPPAPLDYVIRRGPVISGGPVPQQTMPAPIVLQEGTPGPEQIPPGTLKPSTGEANRPALQRTPTPSAPMTFTPQVALRDSLTPYLPLQSTNAGDSAAPSMTSPNASSTDAAPRRIEPSGLVQPHAVIERETQPSGVMPASFTPLVPLRDSLTPYLPVQTQLTR